MGWFKPKTFRVTFEELGYPQFWIDVKEPGSFLLGEADEITEPLEGDDVSAENIAEVLCKMIMDWNLTDPETDVPLDIPTEKDSSSILRLPTSFLRYLQEAINAQTEEYTVEGAVKKGIEMPLEATSKVFQERKPPSG